jgi:hypothetical protein
MGSRSGPTSLVALFGRHAGGIWLGLRASIGLTLAFGLDEGPDVRIELARAPDVVDGRLRVAALIGTQSEAGLCPRANLRVGALQRSSVVTGGEGAVSPATGAVALGNHAARLFVSRQSGTFDGVGVGGL